MIFSVEHPVITSNFASLAEGRRTTWLIVDRSPKPYHKLKALQDLEQLEY